MATQTFTFAPGTQILTPVQMPQDAREFAVQLAASTTFTKGQALGQKTSDTLLYPLNTAASDGTQNFKGFIAISCKTDANSKVYFATGADTAVVNYFTMPQSTAPMYACGTFDPADLITAVTGAAVAEVDTFTPANPTTGDIYSVYTSGGDSISVPIGATQTATAATTLLKTAWASNPATAALGTASGTATFIVTATTAGRALGLSSAVVGTGTLAKVITTAAVAGNAGEVDTFTPTNPTTADVYTLTATFPDTSTTAISFTIGATQTATAASAGLIAAWNANATLAALATASGTATVILTAVNTGNALSVAGSVVGTGTISKATTTAATGRSISDILSGAPGARVLQNGNWLIP